jgi:hypothetical protein
MKFNLWIFLPLLFSSHAMAETVYVSCGSSKGYSYYFQGGAVKSNEAGFTEDGISNGLFTLTVDEKNNGEVLFKDTSGVIKSASSQGGIITVMPVEDKGFNWLVLYPEGSMEVYSLKIASMKVVSYRNTVGNRLIAKNSLLVSDCKAI